MIELTESPFLEETVCDALQYAKRSGSDGSEVMLTQESGFSVTARNADVETLEHQEEKTFVVTVYHDQRTGTASTTDLSKAAIATTIDKAMAFARYAGQDPYAGLADPDCLSDAYPDLSLYCPWRLTPADAIQIAVECERIALEHDPRVTQCEGASVSTYDAIRVYGNSHGFLGTYPVSEQSISCGVIAEQAGEMQRDYDYTAARSNKDLEEIAQVSKHAVEKTVMRLGAQKIKTQACPVIYHAPAAKSLLSAFIRAISGGNLYRETSFLLDSLGKSVFPEYVHIYQRPHLLKGMGSAPFDSEGVKTRDIDYVSDGKVASYVLGSYSARKLGMKTTGNAGGVYNLSTSHSNDSLQKLFKAMGTGLFVTELIGQGVNMVTGDYSRGAAGFWIENGEIQYPVHEITIAGNLKTMFQSIQAIGNDVDHRGNIHTGSIWIEKMMVAGE